jgi:hypothetical protein
MKRWVPGLLGVLAGMGLPACGGSAVLIGHTANGGTLGLDGDHQQAMADARRLMSESCGGAYTIVGERNVIAGKFRGRTIAEYQVRYVCRADDGRPPTP